MTNAPQTSGQTAGPTEARGHTIKLELSQHLRGCFPWPTTKPYLHLFSRTNTAPIMRDKLIQTAIEKFGRAGFDGVGTREIAAAVDTNMSSITYHFGSKEGLYLAAAEHIFDSLQQVIGASPEDFPADGASAETRLDWMCNLLRSVAEFMLREESAPFALFIGREQQAPSGAVLNLMNEKMRPMMEAFVTQVEALRPDLSGPQARATTLYLFGMTVTLRHSRASLRLLLQIEEIDPETASILLEQLQNNVRLVLSQRVK